MTFLKKITACWETSGHAERCRESSLCRSVNLPFWDTPTSNADWEESKRCKFNIFSPITGESLRNDVTVCPPKINVLESGFSQKIIESYNLKNGEMWSETRWNISTEHQYILQYTAECHRVTGSKWFGVDLAILLACLNSLDVSVLCLPSRPETKVCAAAAGGWRLVKWPRILRKSTGFK